MVMDIAVMVMNQAIYVYSLHEHYYLFYDA